MFKINLSILMQQIQQSTHLQHAAEITILVAANTQSSAHGSACGLPLPTSKPRFKTSYKTIRH